MRKIIISSVLFCSVVLLSCSENLTSSDNITSETINVGVFNEIEVSSGLKVSLQKGDVQKVEVTANENLHKSIEVKVIENELKITKQSGVNFDSKANVTIVVTYTNLEGVDGTGNSNITFVKPFNGDKLEIELTGSSSLSGEIITRKLDADLAGTSLIDIIGSASEYELDLNGGSIAKSFSFVAENFDGDFNGGSNAELTINKNIELEATGGSQLNYKGNATILEQKLTGGSTINKK